MTWLLHIYWIELHFYRCLWGVLLAICSFRWKRDQAVTRLCSQWGNIFAVISIYCKTNMMFSFTSSLLMSVIMTLNAEGPEWGQKGSIPTLAAFSRYPNLCSLQTTPLFKYPFKVNKDHSSGPKPNLTCLCFCLPSTNDDIKWRSTWI